MNRLSLFLLCTVVWVGCALSASAATVIPADQALVRTEGGPLSDGGWNLWTGGRVGQPVRIKDAGAYQVVVRAFGSPAAEVWPRMAFLVDGRAVRTAIADRISWTDYPFEVKLPAGVVELAVAFMNDAVVGHEDRNLYLDRITVKPPPGAADVTLAGIEEWSQAAGCLRSNMSPKPIYDGLRHLIHEEWKTKRTGTTDRAGLFSFRGFYGTYRITVTGLAGQGSRVEKNIRILRRGPTTIDIAITGLTRQEN